MFKLNSIVFILFIVYNDVRCESESVTTVLPNYSANQVDDEIVSSVDQAIENKVSNIVPAVIQEITENVPKVLNEIVPKATSIQQYHIDDLNSQRPVEIRSASTEEEVATTIQPAIRRVKRAPRYTVREILAPNGVLHEVGHLRDHAMERVGRLMARSRLPRVSARGARLAAISRRRTEIHHKFHHIPNHLAYLPVVGPLLDENRRRRSPLRALGARLRRMRRARLARGPLFRRLARGLLFRRLRRDN